MSHFAVGEHKLIGQTARQQAEALKSAGFFVQARSLGAYMEEVSLMLEERDGNQVRCDLAAHFLEDLADLGYISRMQQSFVLH
jgi:hypothetical protein